MAINIVSPHPGVIEQATAGGQMTYRGGPLLSAVEVSAVFLGDWTAAGMQPIEDFLKVIVPSVYLDGLKEYNIGHGSYLGSAHIPWTSSPVPGCNPISRLLRAVSSKSTTQAVVTDSQIQTYLRDAITAGKLPAKTPQGLYMTFVSSGTTVVMSDGSASCVVFCGYHESDNNGLYYGVIPYPSCSGCIGTLTPFEALTSVTTHEIAEAATDPIPGQGWYNDTSGEIGDPCAWNTYVLDGYTVQREYLNSLGGCG